MRSAFMVSVFITLVILSYPALSQEESTYVCFVHFTEQDCPNCRAIDSFIENMTDKYNNTLVITYDLDVPGNGEIFDLYSQKYGIYRYMPAVLFGEYDFFVSMDDIKAGLEKRIIYYTERQGNECPSVPEPPPPPPGYSTGEELPGSPVVTGGEPAVAEWQKRDTGPPAGEDEGAVSDEDNAVPPPGPAEIMEMITSPEDTADYFSLAFVILVVVVAAGVAVKGLRSRKGGRKKRRES